MEKFAFTLEELEGIGRIRKALGKDLPPDLDTDFNLRRWWIGWKGSLENIIPRFRHYIENRKAAGFDCEDFIEKFYDLPQVKPWLKFFPVSRLGDMINEKNNTFIFVQRMEGVDYRRCMKVMKMSDFLYMYLAYCELMLRLVIKREAETGRPSGISVIYDMQGAELKDFLNPNAPINKVAKLTTHIVQEQFCEILTLLVAYRPPAIFTVIWQFMRLFLNENTLKKIDFTSKSDELLRHFDPESVPVAYGGQTRDNSGWGNPDTSASIPEPIPKTDKHVVGSVWDGMSVTPPLVEEYIRPGAVFQVVRRIETTPTVLGWQFMINGEMEFAILRKTRTDEKVQQRLVYPRFHLITAKLPEEGKIRCTEPGDYVFEFVNTSSYMFSIKLQYAVCAINVL